MVEEEGGGEGAEGRAGQERVVEGVRGPQVEEPPQETLAPEPRHLPREQEARVGAPVQQVLGDRVAGAAARRERRGGAAGGERRHAL